MRSSHRTIKFALVGMSALIGIMAVEILQLRARNSSPGPVELVRSPQPSPKDQPEVLSGQKYADNITWSIGFGLGERLLDVGGFQGPHASLAVCEDGKIYDQLVFETVQTEENMAMTRGRFHIGEIIDHVGARYRTDNRSARFPNQTTCVFIRGVGASDIEVKQSKLCNQGNDKNCTAPRNPRSCTAELADLRSRKMLAESAEILKSLCKPITDEVYFVDLVSREDKQCFYGAFFKISDSWIPLDALKVDYKSLSEEDPEPHCYIEGGETLSEADYFWNEESSRLDIGLNFLMKGKFYFLTSVVYGETFHIQLHRINDNKVEVLARGGGYAVPL